MALYFEMKDFIEEREKHPNFDLASQHLRAAMVWAKEGVGVQYGVADVVDEKVRRPELLP